MGFTILKHRCYVSITTFNNQRCYMVITLLLCAFYESQNKQQLSTYDIQH